MEDDVAVGSVGRYILHATLVMLISLSAVIWIEFSTNGALRVAYTLHDIEIPLAQPLHTFDPMTSKGQTILAFVGIIGLIVPLLGPVIARYAVAFQTYQRARCKPLFIFACLAVLCIAMAFHSLTQYADPDEEQYVTAAYLAQHMRLYADFLYPQTPIYPLTLSKLFILFSGVSPYLIARLLSAVLAIGSVIVFFGVAARLSRSKRLAAILASLFASAPLMLLAYGSARNDIMPISFGLCGVWLTLRSFETQCKQYASYLTLFFAGFCMALAVCTKVTAAFIPLSALLYIFLRAKAKLLPLILGGAVGSLPIVYYAATTFDKFLYSILTFHLTAPKELYIDMGMAEILTWPYRIKFMMRTWAGEPALVVAAVFIAFVAFAAWRSGPRLHMIKKYLFPDRIFMVLLMVAAIPFVFLPNPAGKPYLQPAVPYVLLSWAALYPLAQRIMEPRQIHFFAKIAIAVLALQAGRFVIEGVRLNHSAWTVTQVHELSVLIAHHVKEGPVATLYPTLALDAGSPIYPQFATAFYFYLSGNHVAPERVVELNGISASTLPLLLSAKRPAAVFIGTTSDYERPLLNWAKRNRYKEVDISRWQSRPYRVDIWKPRLFVRPGETRGGTGLDKDLRAPQPRWQVS